MKHNYQNYAHGGCRKRAMVLTVVRKVLRSVAIILHNLGKGILQAIRSWTDSAPARGW